jgi:hypothetical protein
MSVEASGATPETPTQGATPETAAPAANIQGATPETPETAAPEAALSPEVKALIAKLRGIEKEHNKLKAATMSEAEKMQLRAEQAEQRATELETRLRTATARSEAASAAREAKAIRPESVAKLIDVSALVFGDAGDLDAASLKKEVARVKSEFPELFQSGNGTVNGAAGKDGAEAISANDMNSVIRGFASR